MTKDELIVKQQLEIERLHKGYSEHQAALDRVHGILFCIGGPLNDSKLGYTREQMCDFLKIKDALGI
jgi:hypothetical protein